MKIAGRGTVVRSKEGTDRQSCAFPGICVLPSGRWICGFRAGPTKAQMFDQKALITWSDDEGKTWSEPIDPFKPCEVDGKRGVFRVVYVTSLGKNEVLAALYWVDYTNPSFYLFNEQTQGLLDSKVFLTVQGG